MTDERKNEIVAELLSIYDAYEPTEEETQLTMFGLVSRYNSSGHNAELIGGNWVVESCPEPIRSLPV